jgi:hypothetical protein
VSRRPAGGCGRSHRQQGLASKFIELLGVVGLTKGAAGLREQELHQGGALWGDWLLSAERAGELLKGGPRDRYRAAVDGGHR